MVKGVKRCGSSSLFRVALRVCVCVFFFFFLICKEFVAQQQLSLRTPLLEVSLVYCMYASHFSTALILVV